MTKKLQNIYNKQDSLPKIIDDESFPTLKVKDYVPQQLTIIGDFGEKVATDIRNIFAPTEKGGLHPGKIEIIGNTGTGKSSIHTIIAYLWSIGEIFNPGNNDDVAFDYVYKVKLKSLANKNWIEQAKYTQQDENHDIPIETYPLACFIHYALDQSMVAPRERMTLNEIRDNLSDPSCRDKILFLFDNAEDVSHLVDEPGIVKDVIKEAFSFKYVVMTARPNSLTTITENEFDRKLESSGYNDQGIEKYTKQYFAIQHKQLKKELKKFFNSVEDSPVIDKSMLLHFSKSKDPELRELFIQLKRIPPMEGEMNKANILTAIDNYYIEVEELLDKFLINPSVMSLISNPINAAILCLLISDPAVRVRFAQNFREDELYAELMLLVGKRFISKTTDLKFREITEKMVMELNEFKILKEVAYESIKQDRFMSGEFINRISIKYNSKIADLYKFGLLKITYQTSFDEEVIAAAEQKEEEVDFADKINDSGDLIKQNHKFINVGFIEYLGAVVLLEKLRSDQEAEYKEAAQIIADNRNDPKYLELLEFIAGMMSNGENQSEIAITRFWEAVSCNIDGVLEFGMDRKVTLLMNLLVKTKIDSRIPNLNEMIEFIDNFIMQDFSRYKHLIEESGYLSKRMEKHIWEALEKNIHNTESFSKSFLTKSFTPTDDMELAPLQPNINEIIEISGMFLNRFDNGKLFDILMQYLEHSQDLETIKLSMNVIGKIIKSSGIKLYPQNTEELLLHIGRFVDNDILKSNAIKVLEALIYINRGSEEEIAIILRKLIPLIKTDINNEDLCNLIGETAYIGGSLTLEIALRDLMQIIQEINTAPQKSPSSTLSAKQRAITENKIFSEEVRHAVIQVIYKILAQEAKALEQATSSGVDPYPASFLFVKEIKDLLHDEHTRDDAAYIISQISLTSGIEMQKLTLGIISASLDDSNLQQSIIVIMNSVLNNKTKMDPEFLNLILEKLVNLIANPGSLNIEDIIEVISKVITVADDITTISLELRKNILTNLIKIADHYSNAYSVIGHLALSGDAEMLKSSFDELLPWFEIKKIQSIDFIETAMENLTSGVIPADIASVFLVKLIPFLYAGDSRVAKSIANIALSDEILVLLASGLNEGGQIVAKHGIADSPLPSVLEFIAENLVKLTKNEDVGKKDKAISAIQIIIEKTPAMKSILYPKLVEYFNANPSDAVIMLIGKMGEAIDNDNYKARIDDFITKLDRGSCNKILISEAIANMTKINANARMIILEQFLNDHSSSRVISTISHAISKVVGSVEVNVEIVESIFKKIITLLPNSNLVKAKVAHINTGAIHAIGKLLEKLDNIDLITEDSFRILMLSLSNKKISFAAMHAVNQILSRQELIEKLRVKMDQKLTSEEQNEKVFTQIFNKLKEVLDRYLPASMMGKVAAFVSVSEKLSVKDPEIILTLETITSLVKLCSMKHIIILLKDKHPSIHKIILNVLMEKLTASLTAGIDHESDRSNFIWQEEAENMLSILKYDATEKGSNTKKLHNLAHKNLQKHVKYIETPSKDYDSNLEWIMKHFNDLLSKDASYMFMRLVIHKILSDEIITSVESNIISACIKSGLTVTITTRPDVDANGEYYRVNFDGQDYRLRGEDNINHIEEIAQAALHNKDPIAMQYIEYKALFTNTGKTIKQAATDIPCNSLLNDEYTLSSDSWVVSFLYKSDHLRSSPTEVYIFAEQKRLGDYYGCKFKVTSGGRISSTIYRKHPMDLVTYDTREEIFSSMEYTETKVRYFGSIFTLKPSDGVTFDLSSPNNVVIDSTSPTIRSFSASVDALAHSPRAVMRSINRQESSTEARLLWKFLKGDNVLHSKLKEVKITGNWAQDKTTFTEFDRAYLLLEHNRRDSIDIDYKDALQSLNLPVLTKIIEKEKLSAKAQDERVIIESDIYKESLYIKLIEMLNAAYIASGAISSGRVENQEHGAAGTAGNLLIAVSAHASVLGPVLSIIGAIFNKIDADDQAVNIENYTSFGRDPVTMAEIAEIIARKIVLKIAKHNLIIQADKSGIFLDFVDDALGVVDRGIAGNIVNICGNVFRAIKGAVTSSDNINPEEIKAAAEKKKGEDHAEVIAAYIMKEIYAGKHNIGGIINMAKARAKHVYKAAEKHFSHTNNPQDLSSSSLDANDQVVSESDIKVGGVADNHPDAPQHRHSWVRDHCTIMKVLTEPTIFDGPEYQRILKLPVSERSEAAKAFMERNFPENKDNCSINHSKEITDKSFLLRDNEGRNLLQKVSELYGAENLLKMIELGRDQEIAEQILVAVRLRGAEEILELFFGSNIEFAVENIEKIISVDKDSSVNGGFYQYIHNSLANNHYTKAAKSTLKAISDLSEKLEKWLDRGESGNKVTAAMLILENLIEIVGSGQKQIPMYRPPYYDPGDDYGPEGSGGSSGEGRNSSNPEINNIDYINILPSMLIYNGTYNATSDEGVFVGNSNAMHDM